MNGSGPELELDQAECPRLVDSGAYLLGALTPPERADYAAHLARCPTCQREVGALAYVAALLSRTTAPATGCGTTSPREQDRDEGRAARARRWLPTGALAVLVAAALGGALALGIALLPRPGASGPATRKRT